MTTSFTVDLTFPGASPANPNPGTAPASFYKNSGVYVPPQPPINTVLPTISGVPKVGVTLSVTTGAWNNSPILYSYQWLRNGNPIGGANGTIYVPVHADAGTALSCTVTATNAVGSTAATSASTALVTEAPSNVTPPAISGSATQGQILTAVPGVWNGFPNPTRTYQWTRSGLVISGATASTYLLGSADVGLVIYVIETATNSAGTASASSTGVGPVVSSGYTASLDFSDARNSQYIGELV
jgi:hypothetical protein